MKRYLVSTHLVCAALLVLGAAAPCVWAGAGYSSVILTDTPIGYWRLGESSTAPVAADASGLTPAHNGVYSRGVTPAAVGAVKDDPNTGAAFDGMTGFVDILGGAGAAGTSNANPFDLTSSFSLEAWVINNGPIESTTAARIITTRVLPPGTSGGYGLGVLAGTNNVRFTTFGVKDYDSAATNIPTDGNWHYLVAVLDSTFALTLYLDGEMTDFIQGTAPANQSPTDLHIGRNPVADGSLFYEAWNGSIAEVAVYNYELTAAQVTAHYQAAQ
jgi:hypothetical protein